MPDRYSSNTPRPLPPLAYLRECFHYHPQVGRLYWKERPREHFPDERVWTLWNTKYAWTDFGTTYPGGTSGTITSPTVPKYRYFAHRIIFKLMTGQEPPETIDHIDGDPLNNRWNNLRAATKAQQNHNQRLRNDNTIGYRGVYRFNEKWQSKIQVNSIIYYCGTFNTAEEAAAAYEAAARKLHGKFYRQTGYAPEKFMRTKSK